MILFNENLSYLAAQISETNINNFKIIQYKYTIIKALFL
jgi:hypothetical protein